MVKRIEFAKEPTEFGKGLILGIWIGGIVSLLGIVTGPYLF